MSTQQFFLPVRNNKSTLPFVRTLGCLAIFWGAAALSSGADITSTWNTSSGNWGVAANWNPSTFFPNNGSGGFTYDAVLNNGGSITLNQNITIQKFTLSSGTLTGAFSLTLNENLAWTGGQMSGTGATSVAGAGSTISGTDFKVLARALNNSGTMTDSTPDGFPIFFGDGTTPGVLNNSGTFNVTAGGDFVHNHNVFDRANAINNSGTWNVSGAGTTSTVGSGIAFNNTGSVNVQSGTLELGGGGTSTGSFAISAGAALNFTGGTSLLDNGTNFTGAGLANVSGGTVTAGNDAADVITAANFGISGGPLNGAGTLNVSNLTWTGGALSGTGATSAAGPASTISGTDFKVLTRVLNNSGTMTYSTPDGSSIFFSDGNTPGVLNNSGTFNVTAGGDFFHNFFDSNNAINNSGTWNVSGAATTSTVGSGIAFNNTGIVNVQTGTLDLQGTIPQHSGSTLTGGTWVVSNGGTLIFNDGGSPITTNNGDVTLSGLGSTFDVINGLSVNEGAFTIANGKTFTTAGDLTNTGALHVNDPTSVLTVNGSLANSDTTTVQGTLAATSVGTTGVVEMQGGTLNGPLTVHSGGTLRGSGTTGAVSVEDGGTISPGLNTGAGLLHAGNLSLTSGANFVMDLNGTAPGTQYDQVAVNGTVSLGSSHLVLNLGFSPSVGNQFVLIDNDSTDAVSGTFNGLAEGASVMGFTITYAGGTGNDVVLKAVPEPQTWVSFLSGTGLLLVVCSVKRGSKNRHQM